MKMHEGIGVVTNGPTYEWQINNLKNYLHISPYTPKSIAEKGFIYGSNGQGSGMLGLPGDQNPPARFVKTAMYLKYSLPVNTAGEAVILAEHILNSVDIPIGVSRARESDGKNEYDDTQWIVIKDLKNKIFYFRTYNNQRLYSISFKKLDFSPKATILKMPLEQAFKAIDITQQLKKSPS